MDANTPNSSTPPPGFDQGEVHNKIGVLTRQLHDALRELGYAERLRGAAEELPDAQNRLSYIARLTGQAAEKVLTLVDNAKERQSSIVDQTKAMRKAMIADPVAAVAKGHIMNYLEDMEEATSIVDNQLTDIMMAQDFHDLTGQVIAKVVTLAGTLENQLVELLLQTAPANAVAASAVAANAAPAAAAAASEAVDSGDADDIWAAALAESSSAEAATPTPKQPSLSGPVVDPNAADVVTSQSQVDDLLASLGF
ncbi:MAG: protein phosphatase CheZ [Comamonas sp.]